MLTSILIANRGEIAARIIRTTKQLGYRTVALFSHQDRDSLPVQLADEAIYLDGMHIKDTYLNQEKIIAAARLSQVDAIHPGYGLFSENAGFAQAVMAANIVFIGPSPGTIALMADKGKARKMAQTLGIGCIPGYDQEDQSNETLIREALNIGLPVLIKAALGGGGRGMRRVTNTQELEGALKSARQEAQIAFADGHLIIEKAITDARHIEVQILADHHGHVVHLGARDCSIQRRHQKVIEESPASSLSEVVQNRLYEAAIKLAKACDYKGVGTVEFLVDGFDQFYFLEMNTRLQVEHPVTEFVVGLDLVEWQLRVANGETLAFSQEAIQMRGHAIEARIYAEDVTEQFMGQTGTIHYIHYPSTNKHLRFDHNLYPSQVVSADYDSMLGKLIAYGDHREDAIRRLHYGLSQLTLLGLTSNIPFLLNCLTHADFLADQITTDFIEHHPETLSSSPSNAREKIFFINGLLIYLQNQSTLTQDFTRLSRKMACLTITVDDNTQYTIEISTPELKPTSNTQQPIYQLTLTHNNHTVTEQITVTQYTSHTLCFIFKNHLEKIYYYHKNNNLYSSLWPSQTFSLETYSQSKDPTTDTVHHLYAPIDGLITDIRCNSQQPVESDEIVVLLEAMKIEYKLKAPYAGTIKEIYIEKGQQVKRGQTLIEFAEK